VSKIELCLRFQLLRDSLSSLLKSAGFAVPDEPDQHDDRTVVLIGLEAWEDPERVQAYQRDGVGIVLFAPSADELEISRDELASLSGVLTLELSAEQFVQSLSLICSGERVFPSHLVVRRKTPVDTEPPSGYRRLTTREREVLALVVEGRPNKVIARELGMAEATVKVHLKSLMRKLNVANRTQAAVWGLGNRS